jgi:hypothetical protein
MTVAIALAALVVVLDGGGTSPGPAPSLSAPPQPAADGAAGAPASGAVERGMTEQAPAGDVAGDTALPPAVTDRAASGDRKVERTANLTLGTPADRIDEVAQGVLGVVARQRGIVDQSSVSSSTGVGSAQFELRIPAARLQPALAALSQLPDAHVLARSDDSTDVNQAYVTTRRRLANAEAERAGVVRALRAADTEQETLRLRARLDALERTIALVERQQRALDRRVDFSRVAVEVRATDNDAVGDGAGGAFTVGSAFHDGLRLLEVAAGVLVIAAAALLPLALLLACGWPLARTLRRRGREHALDAA